MRRLTWVIAVTAMVLLIAACGGDSGGNGGSGGTAAPGGQSGDRTVDVCSLVSTAEAEVWLGPGVVSGMAEGPSGPYPEGCTYKSADGSAQILLGVYDGEKYFAGPDHQVYTDSVIVTGLGEIGFTANRAAHFLQNDWAVSVSSIAGGVPDPDLVAMAQVVSANLP